VKGRKPGTALDVAMGQGRNAVYLATQGWKVTGVDISDEGMRMAKEAAAAQKLKLDTVTADLDKYDFGKDRWDLVTLIYAGSNADEVQRILPSIKKGGLFVCEYFHADSEVAKTGAGGWATGKLAELFTKAGGFKILRDDVVDDNADWGQRKTKLVRFVAQRL
jgi:ubiquinone/menaquinone biosynthesis C-methylase UbiE